MSKRLGSANLKIEQETKDDFSNIMGQKQLQVIATACIFQPVKYLLCELLTQNYLYSTAIFSNSAGSTNAPSIPMETKTMIHVNNQSE